MSISMNFEILEHLPAGICIIDSDFKTIYWNDTIESWTKINKNKIIGHDIRDYFEKLTEPQIFSRTSEVFKGGPPVIFSSQIHNHIFNATTLQGVQRIQNVIVSAIPAKEENCFFAMFSVTDVTEMTIRNKENRKLRIEAEKKAKEIYELNAQKDKFFSIISHDLKSPFNGFIGLLKLLVDDFGDFTREEIFEMTGLMYNSANSVYELLETLLEWARSQQGKIPYKPEKVLIGDIINRQVKLFQTVANAKNIDLVTEISDEKIFGFFDFKMIDTVLRNLVSNAIKFTYIAGKVKISAKEINENEILLNVSDNGMGIPEESLKNLFRIDTHVTTLGTSDEKGTGLGLILCKDFIEKNGGKIWVDSIVNSGTTFNFTLKKEQ